ncbi:MAG: hypothetical protein WCA06_04925, partial [Terrimicrobiaceae bacterium]
LVEDLRRAVDAATAFCADNHVILTAIEDLPSGGMERLQAIDDAVNALISPDPRRNEFLSHQRLVNTLYNAVLPDPAVLEFHHRVATLTAIADGIRAKLNPGPADISSVMGEIGTFARCVNHRLAIQRGWSAAARPVEDRLRAARKAFQGIETQEH